MYLMDSTIQLLNNWAKEERGAYCSFTVYNSKVNNDHYHFIITVNFSKIASRSNPVNLSEYSRAQNKGCT